MGLEGVTRICRDGQGKSHARGTFVRLDNDVDGLRSATCEDRGEDAWGCWGGGLPGIRGIDEVQALELNASMYISFSLVRFL